VIHLEAEITAHLLYVTNAARAMVMNPSSRTYVTEHAVARNLNTSPVDSKL
jgi:hypothetical protein